MQVFGIGQANDALSIDCRNAQFASHLKSRRRMKESLVG